MLEEKMILKRTIELLVAAGHVSQEKVEQARRLAINLSEDATREEE